MPGSREGRVTPFVERRPPNGVVYGQGNPEVRRALLRQLGTKGALSDMNIIFWIIVGIIAGWLAEQIMGRSHGLLTNLIVGIVGAVIGGFLANALGFAWGGWIGSTIVATIGAIILLFLLGLVKRRA
jgi:uncharacterized membrane protein YeaQ/YmgE (transglycosylase-associated protein family)